MRKTWSFTLSNEPYGASEERLINTLRDGHILENARVEWTQLLLADRPTTARIDLTSMTGDEHTFWYRGRVRRVGPITNESITFECEMEIPELQWLYPTDTAKTDPDHIGVRVAKVAGQAKKVACINWDVGFVSPTVSEIGFDATTIELTDATGFDSTGSGTIGGEEITWTGKSSNTLTGVTRGASGTAVAAHPAGSVLVEAISSATFLVADHQVDAIGDIYVENPYSGHIVRLTTDCTKNVADTTTIAGRTVASITFTQAQLLAALHELATSPEVITEDIGTPPANLQYVLTNTIGYSGVTSTKLLDAISNGLSASGDPYLPMDEDDYIYFRFYRPTGGFPRQRIQAEIELVSGSGSVVIYKGRKGIDTTTTLDTQTVTSGKNTYTVDTTEDAEWITIEFTSGSTIDVRVYEVWQYIDNTITTTHQQATNGKYDGGSEVGSGNWFDENDSTYLSLGSTPEWAGTKYADPGSFHTQRIRVLTDDLDTPGDHHVSLKVSDSDYNAGASIFSASDYRPQPSPAKPDFTFETDETGRYNTFGRENIVGILLYELSRDYVTYGSPPESDIRIKGASVGYGLRLLADVDGYEVPSGASPAYKAGAAGTLMTKPCDILRYILEELGGETIDTATYDACNTNLGSNVIAADLRTMGLTFEEVLARLGFESRTTLIPEETASGRVWKLLTALSTYAFSAASGAITEWARGGFVEVGRALHDELATRFIFHYAPDWSRGDGEEAYTEILIANEDDNDLTVPSTADFQSAEDDFGDLDAEPMALRAIHDSATADDVAGYYAHELIRGGALFAISGVPWWEGYDVEVGDIKNVTPPWGSSAVKTRIIEYTKDPSTEQIELRGVEVE
jgi:hypothetical protein